MSNRPAALADNELTADEFLFDNPHRGGYHGMHVLGLKLKHQAHLHYKRDEGFEGDYPHKNYVSRRTSEIIGSKSSEWKRWKDYRWASMASTGRAHVSSLSAVAAAYAISNTPSRVGKKKIRLT